MFAHIIGQLLETERKRVTLLWRVSGLRVCDNERWLSCVRVAQCNNFLEQAFEALIVASLFAHGCLFIRVGNVLNRVYTIEFDVSKHRLAMTVGRGVNRANGCDNLRCGRAEFN